MSAENKNDEIIIRQAKKEDMAAVAEMIQELADFEKMPDGPKLTVKDLERDGFECSPPLFRVKLATRGAAALGFALYYDTYSTWEGRAATLEDLYVRPGARGAGAGGRLFGAVAEEAAARGTRLDFHVLDWNPTRGWYERRGARDLSAAEGWRRYRLRVDAQKANGGALL